MHEYSIVESLFEQIAETARRQGAVAVRRVRLQIGEIAGVDAELLTTAYELFREQTICADAPLEIEAIPARWSCPGGHGDIEKGRALICASCGEPAWLAAGDEILLRQLELEVP